MNPVYLLFIGDPLADHGVLVEEFAGTYLRIEDAKHAHSVAQEKKHDNLPAVIASFDGSSLVMRELYDWRHYRDPAWQWKDWPDA